MYNHNKFIKLSNVSNVESIKKEFDLPSDAALTDKAIEILSEVSVLNKKLKAPLIVGKESLGHTTVVNFDLLDERIDNPKMIDSSKTQKTQFDCKSYISYMNKRIVVNVLFDDNLSIPFYISTGSGGKKNVPKNKWYAFFGSRYDGWVNKGLYESNINAQYDNPLLQEIAEWLNENISISETLNSGIAQLFGNFFIENTPPNAYDRINIGKNPANDASESDNIEKNRYDTLRALKDIMTHGEAKSWQEYILQFPADTDTVFEWFDKKSRFYINDQNTQAKTIEDLIKNHNGEIIDNTYVLFDNPYAPYYLFDFLYHLKKKIDFKDSKDKYELMEHLLYLKRTVEFAIIFNDETIPNILDDNLYHLAKNVDDKLSVKIARLMAIKDTYLSSGILRDLVWRFKNVSYFWDEGEGKLIVDILNSTNFKSKSPQIILELKSLLGEKKLLEAQPYLKD